MSRMLDAFIAYEKTHSEMHHGHNTIGMQPGTRLYRIERTDSGWRIWTATRDFVHGSYIELHNDGSAYRWECRPDEGDECIMIRWDDAEVHYRWTLTQSGMPVDRGERSEPPPADLADHPTDVVGLTHVHQHRINLNPDNDRLDEINQQQDDC